MGQYYLIINTTKKQYLHPHKFGDGLKLLEFGCSANGTMTGLAVLLSSGNGRGGGDLHSSNPLVGSWAGDSIVISGDYADEGQHVPDEDVAKYQEADSGAKPNLQALARQCYEDISFAVVLMLCDDRYLLADFKKSLGRFGNREGMPAELLRMLSS